MLRLALPLLLGLVIASTARADTLRPPVDDAVWRAIDGAGGDVRTKKVGWLATIGGATWLSFVALVGTVPPIGYVSEARIETRESLPALVPITLLTAAVVGVVLAVGVTIIAGGPVGDARLLLSSIVGGVLASLGVAALLWGRLPSNTVPFVFGTSVVAAGLGTQLLAFGLPGLD